MPTIHEAVRDHYANVSRSAAAGKNIGCCSPSSSPSSATTSESSTEASTSASCGCGQTSAAADIAGRLGYDDADIAALPDGANLGLGCGNPVGLASLREGETVLDLGSGGGVDCLLAADRVGPTGRVIGVDMTPEMIDRARANSAAQAGDAAATRAPVEFRLGEIEHLPVEDNSVDVIVSNCVVNLSPDKPQVLRDAYRVLRPGGRLAIADMVATAPIPDDIRTDLEAHAACIAGAATVDELSGWLAEAGFADIRITPRSEIKDYIREWSPERRVDEIIASMTIEAIKPGG